MSELKLRRLLEHNQRLREDLGRPRIRVSEASASLIRYCKTTTDHLVGPHFDSTLLYARTDTVFLYAGSICMGSCWQK